MDLRSRGDGGNLVWHEDGHHGLRGDALAAAGEPQFFGCRGLDRDAAGVDPSRRKPNDHRRSVRGDLRPLADQRDVGIRQRPPRAAIRPRVDQEPGAVGILPGRLARREMPADIALGQGAIDRVAQRVDADIGIRMAGKAVSCGTATPQSNSWRPGAST